MKKLKILYLEDSVHDAEIVERTLKNEGIDFSIKLVDTQDEYEDALGVYQPDLILADHSLFEFNSLEALKIFQACNLKIPFILVTGTVSEEFAVKILKEGADDYLLKDNLARLPKAIISSLEKFRINNERQKYLENIVANEALLKEAEEMASVGSWQADLITGATKWSDQQKRIFGYDLGERIVNYETFLNHVHPKEIELVKKALNEAMEYQDSYESEFSIIDKAGNVKYIHSKIVIERNSEKKPIRLAGFNQDITERKEAEENTKLSEEKRRLIMNAAIDAIICMDTSGAITFWNPQAEKTFGWKEEEVKNRLLADFIIPPALRDGHTNGLNNYLKTGHGPVLNLLLELRAMNREGKEFPIELTVLPINQGGEEFFCAFIRDISERKHSELLLKQLNESLETRAAELLASNKELERFAYIASHDLQEPLRMVISFLSLLEEGMSGQLDETSREYLHFAVDGAERMKALIQALLQYSRVGINKEEFTATDLTEVMQYVSRVLEEDIKKHEAVITINPMPVIMANKTLITQLFVNMISNALKYHDGKDSKIEVGYTEEQEKYIFYVKDNGIGIDPKFFDKIFIIFQRLHSKSEYSGTGIGLAICKKIVEIHKGKIWIESEEGKGSTFYFSIPKN